MRLGCTIILIHATNCSSQFKVGWNEIYCFTSFCSAVKDNPALNSGANLKNIPKKQLTPFAPSNQKNQSRQPNQKYPGGSSEERQKNGDPKTLRQSVSKTDKLQPNAQATQVQKDQKPRTPFPTNNGGNGMQSAPTPPPQQQGSQFGQGRGKKVFNNGPIASNGNQQQQTQPHVKYNGGNNPVVVPATANQTCTKDSADTAAKSQIILMVGGLPGKMDFKILKENLQLQANKVQGNVKYVKNGQAFITFKNKSNADRAVELFNGKKVYGKSLNVCFTNNIPFDNQAVVKPKSGAKLSLK